MPRDVSLAFTHARSLRRILFMDRALSGISLAVKAGCISRATDVSRFRRDDEQLQAARREPARIPVWNPRMR